MGGLILGVGFVIGGYCPGTSAVSIATGRIDGIIYALGGFFGIFIFGESYPLIEGFVNGNYMGLINIPQLLNINYGLIVFIVILLAIGGFTAAEWGERSMAKKKASES